MEENSEAKVYKNKPELTNGTATICINQRKYSNPVVSRTVPCEQLVEIVYYIAPDEPAR